MLSPGAQQSVIAQTRPSDYDQALARLDLFMEKLEELRSHIDRTQFDVDALSFELAFEDAETIVAYVRDNIYFEQYPGLLRGPTGTLMSRAGNVLDQAVLLQKLLEDAGYETRIVRGTLDDEQAQALVRQMAVKRTPEPPIGDIEAMKATISELSQVADQDADELIQEFEASLQPPPLENLEVYQETQKDSEFIMDVLADAEVKLGDPKAAANLFDEAKDYFWLEYRADSAEAWTAAHTAFHNSANMPRNIEVTEEFLGELPENLHHRVRFQVFIEQKLGDKLVTHAIMNPWEEPTSTLVGTPLTYQNFADGLTNDEDILDIDTLLAKTSYFFPIFNNDLAPGGQAFDLTGAPVPAFAAASPIAAIFQGTNSQLSKATGMLDGLGTPQDAAANPDNFTTITAQFVEYTLINPLSGEKKIRRTIFDRVDPEIRIKGASPSSLASIEETKALYGSHTFMISSGNYTKAFNLDKLIHETLNTKSSMVHLLQQAYGETLSAVPDDIQNTKSIVYLSLFRAFDALQDNTEATLVYRPEPSLIAYEEFATPTADENIFRVGIDIVNNTRLAFNRKLQPDLRGAVRSGIWETHLESLEFNSESVQQQSAAEVLSTARKRGLSSKMILPTEPEDVDELNISSDAKKYIRRDLADGYAVIAPETPNSKHETYGWWRVDLKTGNTLGMLDNGRGSAFTEYLLQFGVTQLLGHAACLLIFAITKSITQKKGLSPREEGMCIIAGVGLFNLAVGAGPVGWLLVLVAGILNSQLTPSSWSSTPPKFRSRGEKHFASVFLQLNQKVKSIVSEQKPRFRFSHILTLVSVRLKFGHKFSGQQSLSTSLLL